MIDSESAKPMQDNALASWPGGGPFTVIENPLFHEAPATADICLYIEDMTRALRGAAIAADQELLAFLLGAAATEARLQAGRTCLDQMQS
jgi:hypothetical protein